MLPSRGLPERANAFAKYEPGCAAYEDSSSDETDNSVIFALACTHALLPSKTIKPVAITIYLLLLEGIPHGFQIFVIQRVQSPTRINFKSFL
jgi:hypothetical protein